MQDDQDPGLAFYLKLLDPIKAPKFDVPGVELRDYGNDPLAGLLDPGEFFSPDPSDIRNAIAGLI